MCATFGPNFIKMCAFFLVKSICFGLNHGRKSTGIRSIHINYIVDFMLCYNKYIQIIHLDGCLNSMCTNTVRDEEAYVQ